MSTEKPIIMAVEGNPVWENYYKNRMLPHQRFLLAVIAATMAQERNRREAERLYEEAIYGRP